MTGVVADASPLIAFNQIGHLSLLQALFTALIIPPAVAREIAPSVASQAWIVERELSRPPVSHVLRANLGAGESEAISLAVEISADRFLVDDRAARRVAQGLGLAVVGTLGVLLAAKRRALLTTIRPSLEALRENGFWISPRLVAGALAAAGESEVS